MTRTSRPSSAGRVAAGEEGIDVDVDMDRLRAARARGELTTPGRIAPSGEVAVAAGRNGSTLVRFRVEDVLKLTMSEMCLLAEVMGVSPAALLGEAAQERVRADLDLMARLSDPVRCLVRSLAQFDATTVASLARVIEHCAEVDRGRLQQRP